MGELEYLKTNPVENLFCNLPTILALHLLFKILS